MPAMADVKLSMCWHGEVLVFEEHGETCSRMLGITDVDLVTAVVLPRISNIETACCVGCPCFLYAWRDMCFHLASKWCERVCIIIVFAPEVCVC